MARLNLTNTAPTLTPFTLSQPLVSVVHTLSTHLPTHRSKILHTPTQPTPTFILVLDADKILYSLEFSPISQCLIAIMYHIPDHLPSLEVKGQTDEILKCPISTDDVKRVCGEPVSCHGDGIENVALVYKDACFTFDIRNHILVLTKIKIGCTISFTPTTPKINCIMDNSTNAIVGVCVTSSSSEEKTCLYFGDSQQDVLTKLGSASEVFYREVGDSLTVVLSYIHLGLDVVMDALTNTTTKIVLHTNTSDHREFCVYSRCFFQLSLTKTSVCTDYKSCDNLLVTPVTNWTAVKCFVDPEQIRYIGTVKLGASTNTDFPFPDTTLYVLFDQLILEVTSTGNIAAITLLSCDSNTNHSLHPLQVPTQAEFKKMTFSDLENSLEKDDDDSSDSLEDSFQSAQSSLQSEKDVEPVNNDKRSVAKEHNALVGSNVNIVINKCEPSTEEERSLDPCCLCYHFTSDSPPTPHTLPTPHTPPTPHTLHTPHSPHTIVYESDTLRILSGPLELTTTSLTDEEIQSYEMVSIDDNQEQSEVTPSDITIATEQEEEPEFIYQPKSTAVPSMMSSRTLTHEKNEATSQREESRSRLLTHTRSSQRRVRGKYIRDTTVIEDIVCDEAAALEDTVHTEEEAKVAAIDDTVDTEEEEDAADAGDNGSSLLSVGDQPSHSVPQGNTQDSPPSIDDLPSTEDVVQHIEDQTVAESAELSTIAERLDQSLIADNITTTGSDVATSDSSPGLIHSEGGVVSRGRWSDKEEFVLETGPPSMTQERVLVELVSSEHWEVKEMLQERLQNMQLVRQLLYTPDNTGQLEELLSKDPSLAHRIMSTITKSNAWTLSHSATLLPWIQQLFTVEKHPKRLTTAALAVLCVAETHTTLLLRHKIGRARNLSVPERRQCIKCYVTLEKIDESADRLITGLLSSKQVTVPEQDLLNKLRELRTALARIFKKVDLS